MLQFCSRLDRNEFQTLLSKKIFPKNKFENIFSKFFFPRYFFFLYSSETYADLSLNEIQIKPNFSSTFLSKNFVSPRNLKIKILLNEKIRTFGTKTNAALWTKNSIWPLLRRMMGQGLRGGSSACRSQEKSQPFCSLFE